MSNAVITFDSFFLEDGKIIREEKTTDGTKYLITHTDEDTGATVWRVRCEAGDKLQPEDWDWVDHDTEEEAIVLYNRTTDFETFNAE